VDGSQYARECKGVAMTTERIDRLEALTETILLGMQQLQEESREQRSLISQMQREVRDNISDTMQMIGIFATEMHNMNAEIRDMKGEIKGLQLENRRILDTWLNRRDEGE